MNDNQSILSIYWKFFPARLLVVLNSLFLVPLLVEKISHQEMGIFKLCIAILSLICTLSSDWISKTAIRFYEKYKNENVLQKYFSNIFILLVLIYAFIFVIYAIFYKFITIQLGLSPYLLLLILILLIPVAIRQFLFQMLRVLNKPFLYALSIGIYQILFVFVFLLLFGKIPNNYSLLISMFIGIFFIDFFMIFLLKVPFKNIKISLNKEIMKECLKYSLPTILSCLGLWFIINFSMFVFQYNKEYFSLATISVCHFYILNFVSPLFSLFPFAIFPSIVQKYENKEDINNYVNNSCKLYMLLFLPLLLIFFFYPNTIDKLIFVGKYPHTSHVLQTIAISQFLLNFTKIVNFKYHLKNRTYIEMGISLFTMFISGFLYIYAIKNMGLNGALFILMMVTITYLLLNLLTKIKNIYSLNYFFIIKNALITIAICFIIFKLLNCIQIDNSIFDIIKILIYIVTSYIVIFSIDKNENIVL